MHVPRQFMCTYARAEIETSKKLFPCVSARGMYWEENKMYKPKGISSAKHRILDKIAEKIHLPPR